jgi:hypothetical protein
MFRKRQTKPIVFTDVIGVAKEYAPQSAIHFIPEWYKKMESYFPKEKNPDSKPTIKKCIPFLDAMTAGYIIVSPCDVYVSFKDGEPNYNSTIPNLIQFHQRKQGYLHPKANEFQFPKWSNPWAIKTPKGYSTLFLPPMHNEHERFVILEGIVDTDAYYAPVNFPFVLKTPTEEFMIPAGTPIAQVIPFKREKWQSSFSNDFTEAQNTLTYLTSRFFDRYKKMFWSRKEYK